MAADVIQQLDLLADPAYPDWYSNPRDATERRFVEWLRMNPHVYEEIKRRALVWYRAGAGRIGVRAIWESARYDSGIRVNRAGEPFKLQDHYAPLVARLLIWEYPELASVIETRGPR